MVQWASIEMFSACIVANAAFYYALLKDLSRGHDKAPSLMTASAVRQSSLRASQTNQDWMSRNLSRGITLGPVSATAARSMNGGKELDDDGFPTSIHVEKDQLQPKDYS
jgi:hypothetical protein